MVIRNSRIDGLLIVAFVLASVIINASIVTADTLNDGRDAMLQERPARPAFPLRDEKNYDADYDDDYDYAEEYADEKQTDSLADHTTEVDHIVHSPNQLARPTLQPYSVAASSFCPEKCSCLGYFIECKKLGTNEVPRFPNSVQEL